MRLWAAILLFCVGISASAELITVYPDGVNQELEPLISVYLDGVPPNGDEPAGEPPIVPSGTVERQQFLDELFTDTSDVGTNFMLGVNSPLFVAPATTIDDHYDMNGTTMAIINGAGVGMGDFDGTSGSISAWVRVDADDGAANVFVSADDTSVGGTEIQVLYDLASDYIRVKCAVDGVAQWDIHTPADSTDALIGTIASVIVTHNGTRVNGIWINGVSNAMTDTVTTDLTAWFSDFAAATNPWDTWTLGAEQQIGSQANFFDGSIWDVIIWNDVALTESQVTNYVFNNKVGHGAIALDLIDPNLDDLVLNYPLEYLSGTTFGDESVNGNNGINNGSTFSTASTNGFSSMNGTTDEITSTSILGISGSAARTYMGWYLRDASTNFDPLFVHGVTGTRTKFQPYIDSNDEFHLFVGNGEVKFIVVSNLGVWEHYALVYVSGSDIDEIKLYINGVDRGAAVGTNANPLDTTDTTLLIGEFSSGNWGGDVDDIRVYDVALSSNAVFNIHAETASVH